MRCPYRVPICGCHPSIELGLESDYHKTDRVDLRFEHRLAWTPSLSAISREELPHPPPIGQRPALAPYLPRLQVKVAA